MGTQSGTGYGVHSYEMCHPFWPSLAGQGFLGKQSSKQAEASRNEEGLIEQVQRHRERNQGGQTRIPLDI